MSLLDNIKNIAQKSTKAVTSTNNGNQTKKTETAQTDFGSSTVQLNKSSAKTYSVNESSKKAFEEDKKADKENKKDVSDFLSYAYKTESGTSLNENSAEMNSAAWALYDNNSDNKEFKDAVALSYKKAQVYAQLGDKLDNDDMIKQVDDFFKNGAKVEDLKDGDLKDALKDYEIEDLPKDAKADDILPEVILCADLSNIDTSKLNCQDVSTLNYDKDAKQALSDAIEFETKQEINLDDYRTTEDLTAKIQDMYNIKDGDTKAMEDAIKDIKAHNESLKDVNNDKIIDTLVEMSSDGKAGNDMIATSSNFINSKIQDFDKMDANDKKSVVMDEIAKQYGIDSSELTTSAAGQNILNNIMYDVNNDDIFNGKTIKNSDDVLQCIADSVKDNELKLATPDAKISFIGDENDLQGDLKAKALEKGDFETSYLSVTQDKVTGEELSQIASKDKPTAMDLLNYVQYESEVKGNDSLTLKNKYDEFFNADGSIKDGVDANEAASIKALCESSVQQLLDTNPNIEAANDILTTEININANDTIELQSISYLTQKAEEEKSNTGAATVKTDGLIGGLIGGFTSEIISKKEDTPEIIGELPKPDPDPTPTPIPGLPPFPPIPNPNPEPDPDPVDPDPVDPDPVDPDPVDPDPVDPDPVDPDPVDPDPVDPDPVDPDPVDPDPVDPDPVDPDPVDPDPVDPDPVDPDPNPDPVDPPCIELPEVNPGNDNIDKDSTGKKPEEGEDKTEDKTENKTEDKTKDDEDCIDKIDVTPSKNDIDKESPSKEKGDNSAEATKAAAAKKAAEEAAAAKAAQEAAAKKAAEEAAAKKAAEEAAAKAAQEAAAAKAAQEAAAAKAAQEAAAAKAAQEAAAKKAAEEAQDK